MKLQVHSAYSWLAKAKRGQVRRRDGGLVRWLREKWVNLTPWAEGLVKSAAQSPACGSRHPQQRSKTVCRPSVRVSHKTPSLASSFTKAQISRAMRIKNRGGTVHWKKL